MLYVKGFLVALQGVPVTVGVTLIAMVTGVVLGLVLALMKMSRIKVLTALASLYIEIIRGTTADRPGFDYGLRTAAAVAVQRHFLSLAVFDYPRCYRVRAQQRRLCGGGHPQRYSGGGQGTDGSCPLHRNDQGTGDETDRDSSGAENRAAFFRQRVCEPDQRDVGTFLCGSGGDPA